MDSVTPGRGPITYRLVLGEDWYRIQLGEDAGSDVEAFLDVVFDGIPSEAAEQTRALITALFMTQIAAARSKRGIELLVPAPKPHGAARPATVILVAEVVIPAATTPDPVEVVARVARDNAGARTGVVAGSAAVRIDHSLAAASETETKVEAGDETEDTPPAAARIEYVIAVPEDPRWLSIDLSVQAVDGFDMSRAIMNFDRAVADLTWTAPE